MPGDQIEKMARILAEADGLPADAKCVARGWVFYQTPHATELPRESQPAWTFYVQQATKAIEAYEKTRPWVIDEVAKA